VEDALVACSRGRARVAALERTVAAARRTLELAVRLYKDGLTDFQSVLDAQRSLFAYDNQLAQARGDFSLAVVRLYKALGGGWQSTQGVERAGNPAGNRGKK
jgi:outer membrane protein TolC